MKKKKTATKNQKREAKGLELRAETVRTLEATELEGVSGGLPSHLVGLA